MGRFYMRVPGMARPAPQILAPIPPFIPRAHGAVQNARLQDALPCRMAVESHPLANSFLKG